SPRRGGGSSTGSTPGQRSRSPGGTSRGLSAGRNSGEGPRDGGLAPANPSPTPPPAGRHTRTARSFPPVARYEPSRLTATAVTPPGWASGITCSFPPFNRITRTWPSWVPAITAESSGSRATDSTGSSRDPTNAAHSAPGPVRPYTGPLPPPPATRLRPTARASRLASPLITSCTRLLQVPRDTPVVASQPCTRDESTTAQRLDPSGEYRGSHATCG